jgi:hypothetical protein
MLRQTTLATRMVLCTVASLMHMQLTTALPPRRLLPHQTLSAGSTCKEIVPWFDSQATWVSLKIDTAYKHYEDAAPQGAEIRYSSAGAGS